MYNPLNPPNIIVIADTVDSDEFIFKDIDTSAGPYYSVSETAKLFFGRSVDWLLLRDKQGYLVYNGKRVGTRRSPKNHRRYTLGDVEEVAYALFENGIISLRRFRLVLAMLRIQGQQWDHLAGEITVPQI